MKALFFIGSSLEEIRRFPLDARRETGHQLDQVQRGRRLETDEDGGQGRAGDSHSCGRRMPIDLLPLWLISATLHL